MQVTHNVRHGVRVCKFHRPEKKLESVSTGMLLICCFFLIFQCFGLFNFGAYAAGTYFLYVEWKSSGAQ